MVYIYILKLEDNKYYIGKTDNPDFRLEQHIASKGSTWTSIYKPLELIDLIANCDDYDEDKYIRIYMDKYGIDNVRGGSFVQLNFDDENRRLLTKMQPLQLFPRPTSETTQRIDWCLVWVCILGLFANLFCLSRTK